MPLTTPKKSVSLYAKLRQRAAEGQPTRVALIGAGKFGTMYLAQVPRTPDTVWRHYGLTLSRQNAAR